MKSLNLYWQLLIAALTIETEQLNAYYNQNTDSKVGKTGFYSGYGNVLTPKGDLRVLVICAGFGEPYDNFEMQGWSKEPDAIPDKLKDKSTFLSDFSDFSERPLANQDKNVSYFYYQMSHSKFRLIADVYPKRINIDASGASSWSQLNRRVIEKLKEENPGFDWSRYDLRENRPSYRKDASLYSPDKKPDYIIVIYRSHNKMIQKPVHNIDAWGGSNGGYAILDGTTGIDFNGYIFDQSGFTQTSASVDFFHLFIHEIAHSIFECPHYAYANELVGDYFYGNLGWGMMSLNFSPFLCVLGWEKWYLDWINSIKANGENADIKKEADLNASGEYTLRDFMTTGDIIRIKIPGNGIKNHYLWLENHQGKSIFDKSSILYDGCKNEIPQHSWGIVAYIESIQDDKTKPHLVWGNIGTTNGIQCLHPEGSHDYEFGLSFIDPCFRRKHKLYSFKEVEPNPIAGQSRAEVIRADFDSNGIISLDTHYNSIRPGKKNEGCFVRMKDNEFTYDFLGHDITFKKNQKLSMDSNPGLVNVPIYNEKEFRLNPFVLNGISVKILDYDAEGNAKIKITFNDVIINNNIRYCGTIYLPDITQDNRPDIVINEGIALSIDKGGTPNRHTHNDEGNFINPTAFHCRENSYFKQETNSIVKVKRGSSLIIEKNSIYELNPNAELRIKKGSTLKIMDGGKLYIKGSGRIIIDPDAFLDIDPNAIVYLEGSDTTLFTHLERLKTWKREDL